jgi:hypothetical protein
MSRLACMVLVGALSLDCGSASLARAQAVNFGAIEAPHKNMMRASFGAEYAFILGVGYTRIFRIADRPLLVGGDFTLPWATFDFRDYRLRAEVMITIVGPKEWKLVGRVAPVLRGLHDELARFTNFGLETGLAGGYYARHWMIAAELGIDWAFSTHVKHSQRYRSTIYDEAKNGWYTNTGANFNYGGVFGGSFSRYDLLLRIGQGRDLQASPQLLPFYAVLTFNARW